MLVVPELILNLSFLVALSVVSGFIEKKFPRETKLGKVLQGILFGIVAILGMMVPFKLAEGLIFDGRTIVLSLCTFFFGPTSGIIALILTMAYRTYIGGVGIIMGLLTLLSAFLIGWGFYNWRKGKDLIWVNNYRLLLLGFLVHIVMFLLILILPSKFSKEAFATVGFSILVIYPLTTLLIARILLDQEVSTKYLAELERSTNLFRTTLYSIGDAVITTDTRGYIRNMNPIAEELTGWTESHALGEPIEKVFNIVNEFSLQPVENPVERVLREGIVVGLANHTLLISKDGRRIPIADSGAPIKNENGEIAGVVLVFRDQTEERQMRRIIEESELRYRQFVQFSTDGIWRFELDPPIPIDLPINEQIKVILERGYLAECNDVYARMYGFEKASDIVGIKLTDVFLPDDPTNLQVLETFIKNGYKIVGAESVEIDRFGNIKYFENNYVGIIEDNKLVRAWGIQKDITEKKHLEIQLKESEELFRNLAEASLVGIFLFQENKLQYINSALASIYEINPNEIENIDIPQTIHPDDREFVLNKFYSCVKGEIDSFQIEYRIIVNGKEKFILAFAKLIYYKNKPSIVGTLTDITERTRAQQEIIEKENRLRSIFQASPDLYIIFDNQGRYTDIAPTNEELLYQPKEFLLGKTFHEIFDKDLADYFLNAVLKSLNEKTKVEIEYPLEIKGNILHFLASIVPYDDTHVLCVIRNITKRKHLELELKENLELFLNLANSTTTTIILVQGTKFVFVNPAFTELTGFDWNEIKELNFWDVVHPDHREMVKQRGFARMRGEDVPSRYEMKILTKDGRTKWVDFSASRVLINGVPSIVGTAYDITERKEHEILQSIQFMIAHSVVTSKNLYEFFSVAREQLSKLFDTTNFFLAWYDEKTDMLESPFEWDEKADGPPTWKAEKSLTGIVVKENKPLLLRSEDIEKLHEEGKIEYIGSRSKCWMGVPIQYEGKAIGAIVIQSYTERNAYNEKELKLFQTIAEQISTYIVLKQREENLAKLITALETLPVGVLITNPDGFIEYVNSKYSEMSGYSKDEIIGQKPSILKSGHHSADFYKHLWETILSGKQWEGEILDRTKDGKLFWVNQLITPIINESGKITNFVGVQTDITEKKKFVEELYQAKQKAEENEKLRSAFLANISHEVRTPLNAILGFAQILFTKACSPNEVTSFARLIHRRGQDLLRLFNDIIDISLLEAKQLQILPRKAPVMPILYDLYTTFSKNEEFANKPVELRIGKTIPNDFQFSTDYFRLKQILWNLIHNGLKFTERGFVEFGCQQSEGGNLLFYVKDTGEGIPESKKDKVFERFRQGDVDYLTRPHEGLGLGLAISKELVELLGGRIWFESRLGHGSIFYVLIPEIELVGQETKVISEVEKIDSDKEFIRKKHINVLIAEDEYSNFVMLEKFFRNEFNCDIYYARNGQEAVEIAKTHPKINLILLDLRMPVMDGFSALKEIKKFLDVPIFALTAFAFEEDKNKVLRAGFHNYIAKPVDFPDLKRLIINTLFAEEEGK